MPCITLCETFDLSAEVGAICSPLAEQMTAELRLPVNGCAAWSMTWPGATEDVVSSCGFAARQSQRMTRDGLRSLRLTRDLASAEGKPTMTPRSSRPGSGRRTLTEIRRCGRPRAGRPAGPRAMRRRTGCAASCRRPNGRHRAAGPRRGGHRHVRQIPGTRRTKRPSVGVTNARPSERAEAAAQREALEALGVAW